MSDSTIDRRTILSATVAWAAATLSGCSDNGGGSGTGTAGNGGGGGGGGGGTGGTGAGGAGGTGGAAPYACMATMTGSHMHPLTIGGDDVKAAPEQKTYTLADGGTGHMHMVTLSVYDFLYLQAGTTIMRDSTTTNAHLHTCSITCTPS
jgi:hypothetical protein